LLARSNRIVIGEPRLVFVPGDQGIPFLRRETGQFEIEAQILQLGQFETEQFIVPRSVLADLVVGEDQRTALNVGEMRHRHYRYLGHAELAGGKQSAVPGHDIVLPIDQDRRPPAELADAGGYLRDMRIRVLLGVAGVRNQRRDWAVFNVQFFGHRNAKTRQGRVRR
jgi:hypothetical protein